MCFACKSVEANLGLRYLNSFLRDITTDSNSLVGNPEGTISALNDSGCHIVRSVVLSSGASGSDSRLQDVAGPCWVSERETCCAMTGLLSNHGS